MSGPREILAVCGKGGVGKTVLSALLARTLIEGGHSPLLLVDADPVGGLALAIDAPPARTLADVRTKVIDALSRESEPRDWVSRRLDYLVLEALEERENYAMLAIGRTSESGCFCPLNQLLRQALDLLIDPFEVVLVDAEAGVEQITREVTRRVTRIIVLVDGSYRSTSTLGQITELAEGITVSAIGNRLDEPGEVGSLPEGVDLLGLIPEDGQVRSFDRQGRSLWELPSDNPTLAAVRRIAAKLGLGESSAREGAG